MRRQNRDVPGDIYGQSIDYRLSPQGVCRKLPFNHLEECHERAHPKPIAASCVGLAVTLLGPVLHEAAQAALARRIVHTDPAAYRPSTAVHGGAGTMGFTALLNRVL